MRNERELAELIFDKFRASKCKTNEIVMMRNIRFGVIDKLNPKEKEIFDTVLNGLIFTGYYTYHSDSPESIRLTEKGFDYIYDDEKIADMKQKPWVIPSVHETNWDKAYLKLWKTIGPDGLAIHYVGGPQFYKLILKLVDDIPPSYSQYIDERKQKGLSTSRIDYYKDLINHLDVEKRKEFYVIMQLFLEEGKTSPNISTNQEYFDFSTTGESEESTQTKQNDCDEFPIVFISYSWDNPEHEEWVLNLATKLRHNGVNVILDKWDLEALGSLLPNFMEKSITKAQRVICIMTPNYKKKTEHLAGGVGYEYSIITSEIFLSGANTSKFIPLFRSGKDEDAIPTILKGRKYVDMRDDANYEEKLVDELLRDIHNEPKNKKPPIGKKPNFEK